jgi:hypothetical protein
MSVGDAAGCVTTDAEFALLKRTERVEGRSPSTDDFFFG